MPKVNLLNENQIKQFVTLNHKIIHDIEHCFKILATESVVMPPILRLDIIEHHGEVDVKTAYLPGLDNFAIKISPGFFNNSQLGLPSLNGMMILLSSKTGMLESILLDNGYLTEIRTAAAGAISVKYLSRLNSKSIGIVGAGAQAFLQLKGANLVRDLEHVYIWSRNKQSSKTLQTKIQEDVKLNHLNCHLSDDIATLVNHADILITTTPATQPLIHYADLKPGLHITAMGSDAEHKNEIDPIIIKKSLEADSNIEYFCDRNSQTRILGELHHAIKKHQVPESHQFTELGEVLAGKKHGRISDSQITICDLTGTGAQDTMIATITKQLADKAGVGLQIES